MHSPNWFSVIAASVHLLQESTKNLKLCRWLSPFSLGWVIAGLLVIYPLAQKGSWAAIGAAYLLMGVLIVNTLVLGTLSRLPRQVVSFKSQGVETVGLMFSGFICAGVGVLVKSGFAALRKQFTVAEQPTALTTWSNV